MLGSTYTVGKPRLSNCISRTEPFGNSTMVSIAISVLEYCKHKHGQVRGFGTILTKINDVDKEY